MFIQIRSFMHAITETKAKRMFVSLLKYQSGFALRIFRISYIFVYFCIPKFSTTRMHKSWQSSY